MDLIVCTRMYNITEQARNAWRELFAWVQSISKVSIRVIEHAAPAALDDLWRRPDLGCAFMCGWPFWLADPRPQLVAAPVPLPDRYGGNPVYFTDLIVRRDRPYRSIEDTFGGRVAWTAPNSHSGFNALRYHLLGYRVGHGQKLFRASIGPLITPARSLSSIVEDQADVAPMDSYALDLIGLHEPERLANITVLGSTLPAPIPPLVASPQIDAKMVQKLRDALMSAGQSAAMRKVLAALNLKGFADVDSAVYQLANTWHQQALAVGYLRPE